MLTRSVPPRVRNPCAYLPPYSWCRREYNIVETAENASHISDIVTQVGALGSPPSLLPPLALP